MKRLFILIPAMCILIAGFTQNAGSNIDTLLSAYAKLNKFNGTALVAKNGTILLNKGYGYRNAADKVLNNDQSIFQLGSVTKQFTAAVILKLHQERN